jgi:polynucleotide 5'-kinase involved in rRNA processing
VGNLLPTVVGTARLVERARQLHTQTLLVDTTGLVDGPLGRVLKYHKAVAVGVDHLIAIQRDTELEPLLALLQGVCRTIHRLHPAAQARDRLVSERRHYRATRFRAYFAAGAIMNFNSSQLLGFDWTPGPSSEKALPRAGTVLGLLNREGFCLSLGLLDKLEPGRLSLVTPWQDRDAVTWIQPGKIQLNQNGEESSR